MFGSMYLKRGVRCANVATFPDFQKKIAVTKGLASVELQGSTRLTGMGLNIRLYGALATIRVWLPLTNPFSIIEDVKRMWPTRRIHPASAPISAY